MDPHKRSATIEIINDREAVLARGRFGTDRDGYRAMLNAGRRQRIGSGRWRAATASAGISPNVSSPTARLCWMCPPTFPPARGRVFATGPGRKTDPVDAHSVAVAALRTTG